jgi:phosphatidylglycerol---prolipoprotein diacylglyceryl transferase
MELTQFGIRIGILDLRFYGMILMAGAIAGAWLATYQARKRNLSPDLVWDGLLWVLVFGIVGARLWHVFTPSPSLIARGITTYYYFTHPLELINTRAGGLGIYGAIIGGIIGLFFFTRRKNLVFLTWLDIAAPGLALGQAIGRWANYVNGELCGKSTSLPWGIQRCFNTGYPTGTTFHPVFFYESVWSLLNLFLLLYIDNRFQSRLKPGDIFLLYVIIYSTGRFLLEFIRLDSSTLVGVNANQMLALIVIMISSAALIFRHRKTTIPG